MHACMDGKLHDISLHPIDILRSEEERAVEVQYCRCLELFGRER